MDSLEKYLTGEYSTDQREIREAELMLENLAKVFEEFRKRHGGENFKNAWPYSISRNAMGPAPKLSQGTTAMILGALLRLGGFFKKQPFAEFPNISKSTDFAIRFRDDDFSAKLKQTIAEAAAQLIEDITRNWENDENTSRPHETGEYANYICHSSTFGKNDIFTLAWIAECSQADWARIDKALVTKWTQIAEVVRAFLKDLREKMPRIEAPNALFSPPDAEPLMHAFPALRFVQIIRRLEGAGALSGYYRYFEENLHEQLSFSSIPDSRFDPAELAFCLEGMLLCQKNTVDRTLFERVIAVLTDAQRGSAYWRPVKPYVATERGSVIFPVSVEIANSLIRSCEIFDGEGLNDALASKAIPLVKRYWQWLRARAVRFNVDAYEYVGWHSEHVNANEVIHFWETSQAMEFMLSYRNALCMHVARTTLISSRFKYEHRPRLKGRWDEAESKFEPVSALGAEQKIYSELKKDFINPPSDGNSPNYSMLLYGPAGTGKTSVAESIAGELQRRLITVTVSDFLADGGAQVETRAKNVFAVLSAQPPSVILFDEIDHFLLDRDSEIYGKQDTVFQFMTPGMLTKINDLRRFETSIFVVATNYEDRIDPAIKRTGRIDRKYLVLPPDLARRGKIISKLCEGYQYHNEVVKRLTELGEASLFLGYKDLQAAVQSNHRVEGDSSKIVADLMGQLASRARTTSLEAYKSRFKDSGSTRYLEARQTPIAEFLALVGLKLECTNAAFSPSEQVALGWARQVLSPDISAALSGDLIKTNSPSLDLVVANKIAQVF